MEFDDFFFFFKTDKFYSISYLHVVHIYNTGRYGCMPFSRILKQSEQKLILFYMMIITYFLLYASSKWIVDNENNDER